MTPTHLLTCESGIQASATAAILDDRGGGDLQIDEATLAAVRAVAERLDGIRQAVAALGPATLLAELREMPTEVLCEALDELLVTAEWTLAILKP